MPAVHQVGAQEGEQHVSAAEKHGTDLQEVEEQRSESDVGSNRCLRQQEQEPGAQVNRTARCLDSAGDHGGGEKQPYRVRGKISRDAGSDCYRDQQPRLERRYRIAPERSRNDGDDHRLHRVQEGVHLRQGAKAHVRPGQDGHDHGGGKNEAAAAQDQPRPPAAHVAEIDGHLGGVWPGKQVDRTEEVEETLAWKPPAPVDALILHHGNVRRRPAKRGNADLQQNEGNVAQGTQR